MPKMTQYWNSASLESCVLELVLNSLEAKATAVAVRIDLPKQRIEVRDNGSGMAETALRRVAEYSENGKKSLEKIRKNSPLLIIKSKGQNTTATYEKIFITHHPTEVKQIPDHPFVGTTVTAYISKDHCNWTSEFHWSNISYVVACLALVNKQASFTIRDDSTLSVKLGIYKHPKDWDLLKVVCQRPVDWSLIQKMKIHVFDGLLIFGFWGFATSCSRKIQQILLNQRPVLCSKLEKLAVKTLRKVSNAFKENENMTVDKIFFLLYIEAPASEYILSMKNGQCVAEFLEIDKIVACIRKSPRMKFYKRLKRCRSLIYYPNVPPFICRPIGRVLGLKRRKRVVANPVTRSFENWKSRSEREPEVKAPTIIRCDEVLSNDSKINPEENINVSRSKFQDRIRDNDKPEVPEINAKSLENTRGRPVATFSAKVFPTINQSIKNPQNQTTTGKLDHSVASVKKYDNHGVLWISQKCVEKLSSDKIEEMYTINDLSQWSDWNYEPDAKNSKGMKRKSESAHPAIFKRFKFLPLNLHALLRFRDANLIVRASLEKDEIVGEKFQPDFRRRRRDLEVRPCTRRSFEVKLKLDSLRAMKVLNQVNREFIVALTSQENKRLLVIIDQHAMDERIRYENLLRAYRRDQKNERFTSATLRRPLTISDLPANSFNLLSANRNLLTRHGLSLSFRDDNTLMIFAVPRCFFKKTYHADNTEIERVVRKLLQEVLESLNENRTAKFLPFTIHDAIASEACHGAIKFGDPLTVKQCESLVRCWKETEAPNRCAHGRPSVIPLLELSSFERNLQRLAPQEKLNFAALRKSRRKSEINRACRTARYHPYCDGTSQDLEQVF